RRPHEPKSQDSDDAGDDPAGRLLLSHACSLPLAPPTHDAFAASADTRLRQSVSSFSPSTYCTSMPQGFTPPSARLAPPSLTLPIVWGGMGRERQTFMNHAG